MINVSPVDLEQARKQSEMDKKSYDDLVRERDILSKVKYTGILDSCKSGKDLNDFYSN